MQSPEFFTGARRQTECVGFAHERIIDLRARLPSVRGLPKANLTELPISNFELKSHEKYYGSKSCLG